MSCVCFSHLCLILLAIKMIRGSQLLLLQLLWLIGFSFVATCVLTKTICHYCDMVMTPPSNCGNEISHFNFNLEQCYNLHDGVQNVTTEYRVEQSTCVMRPCFDSNIRYRLDKVRVVTMLTCSSGNTNKINIIIIKLINHSL